MGMGDVYCWYVDRLGCEVLTTLMSHRESAERYSLCESLGSVTGY